MEWMTGLKKFYGSLGSLDVLLPLLPFLTVVVAAYVVAICIGLILLKTGVLRSKTMSFYLFVSPWILGFLIFVAGPMLFSLYISFTKWDVLNPPKWVGLQNYVTLISDSLFFKALSVTFAFTLVSVPLQVALSFALSLVMNVKIRGIHLFRTIFYIPTLVQGVAQVVLFLWVFNSEYGLINSLLGAVGIPGPHWLTSPDWAMPAVIIMSLWTIGGNLIIYLAGLQDIPQSLYEAAEMDGA